MKRTLPTLLSGIFFISAVKAQQICPDAAVLKQGIPPGWIALYSASDDPATPELIKEFQKSVQEFYIAEWSEDYQYGYGRCYYQSAVEVSIARRSDAMPKPPAANDHWRWRYNIAQCPTFNVSNCPFG
jgi:hypothetical protein